MKIAFVCYYPPEIRASAKPMLDIDLVLLSRKAVLHMDRVVRYHQSDIRIICGIFGGYNSCLGIACWGSQNTLGIRISFLQNNESNSSGEDALIIFYCTFVLMRGHKGCHT